MSFNISNSNQSLHNVSNKQVIYLGSQIKSSLSCNCQLEAFCDQVRNFYIHLETKQKTKTMMNLYWGIIKYLMWGYSRRRTLLDARCRRMLASASNIIRSSITFLPWRNSPQWAKASSVLRILDHTQTPPLAGLLWTSNQPDSGTYTWQHSTITRDRHPCPRRDSNAQSQQASDRGPTP
jgi:hypothetical protein